MERRNLRGHSSTMETARLFWSFCKKLWVALLLSDWAHTMWVTSHRSVGLKSPFFLILHPPSEAKAKCRSFISGRKKQDFCSFSFIFKFIHFIFLVFFCFISKTILLCISISASSLSSLPTTPIFSPPHSLSTSQPGWGLLWGIKKVCYTTWDRAKAFTLVSRLSRVSFYRQWAPKSKFMH